MSTVFDNSEEVFAIAAATLVLFSAMLDPRVSFALAGLFLVIYAARKIMAKGSKKRPSKRK